MDATYIRRYTLVCPDRPAATGQAPETSLFTQEEFLSAQEAAGLATEHCYWGFDRNEATYRSSIDVAVK